MLVMVRLMLTVFVGVDYDVEDFEDFAAFEDFEDFEDFGNFEDFEDFEDLDDVEDVGDVEVEDLRLMLQVLGRMVGLMLPTKVIVCHAALVSN
jgi:hypothetical protein